MSIATLLVLLALPSAQGGTAPSSSLSRPGAILTVQERVGSASLADLLELHLRNELAVDMDLIDTSVARQSLRRLRIRSVEQSPSHDLQDLGELNDARYLVSATIYEAIGTDLPCLAATIQLFDLAEGNEIWLRFRALSGSGSSSFLGLRQSSSLEDLTRKVAVELSRDLSDLLNLVSHGEVSNPAGIDWPFRVWAVIPFSGFSRQDASRRAEMATSALRSAAYLEEFRLLASNSVQDVLRRQRISRQGEATKQLRLALLDLYEIDHLLTGSLETSEDNAGGLDPNPHAVLGLRVIDAETGGLVWTDSQERRGWTGNELLGLGRKNCTGQITDRAANQLIKRLRRQIDAGKLH